MSLLDQSGVTGGGLDPYYVHALFVNIDNMWTERFVNYGCLVFMDYSRLRNDQGLATKQPEWWWSNQDCPKSEFGLEGFQILEGKLKKEQAKNIRLRDNTSKTDTFCVRGILFFCNCQIKPAPAIQLLVS